MNRFHALLSFVVLAFVAPTLCRAASLAEIGTLHVSLMGESAVEVRALVVSPLETEKRLEEPDRTAAVQNVFTTDIKTKVQALFASAHWEFHRDGTFQVSPFLEPATERLSLEGTYQRFPEVIEVHAVGKFSSVGLVASLDGLLRESLGGYQLEAVYSLLASFSDQWLVEIRQALNPGIPPRPREVPVTWFEGIPIPSQFEVTLQGKMNGRDLPEVTGLLSFRPPDKEHLGPVAIELDAKSLVANGACPFGKGTFIWQAPPADTEPERVRLTVMAGTAFVEVTPRRGDSMVPVWVAPIQERSWLYQDVWLFASWGRLTLTIHEDEVSGQIEAVASLNGEKYQGTFKGRRTSLRSFIGPPAVVEGWISAQGVPTGDWQVEDGAGAQLGDLSLRRGSEGAIEGRFKASEIALSLAGSEKVGILELEEPEAGVFWRLRLLSGGNFLIGFKYSLENRPIRALVARRTNRLVRKPSVTASSIEQLVPWFTTGALLASQGRCPEAIELFEDFLARLRQLAEVDKTLPPAVQGTFFELEEEATVFMARCDLQAGDHDGFLRHLRRSAQLLKPMRETERLAVIESIGNLHDILDQLHREFLKSQIPMGLDQLCRALYSEPDQGTARLAFAFADTNAEISSFGDVLGKEISDLAELRTKVVEGRVSYREGSAALRKKRQEFRERTRSSFARIAAASQQALRQNRRLLEARDKIWANIDLLGTAGDSIQSFAAAIKETPLAEKPEVTLGFLQVTASVFLLMLDPLLQDEMEVLSHTESLPSVVRVATDLAVQPETWRAKFVTDRGKIAALERLEPYFADLMALLLQEGEVGDALAVSEIARSRAFVDLLAGREEIRRGLERLPQRTEDRTFPSPTTAMPPTLDDLLGIVRQRGSTTVEYSLAGDHLTIWVISPEGKVSADSRSVDRAAVQLKIQELHSLLEGRAGDRGARTLPDPARTHQLLRELYGLLIDPIPADRLPGNADEVVTIIPQQELFGVPFAALEDAAGRKLIERHPLVYGTSIAALGAMRHNLEGKERTATSPRLLALVNPSPLPVRADGGAFPSLDKLENGFSRIAGLYPAEGRLILTRQAATKAALRDHGAEADVLQLVTHAEFVEQDPLASFIALAGDEGALHVPEVFRLKLSADLVVLWACETGRGGLSADGVEGLSRSFTWAGASSLLLSLWEIPDEESLIQMEGFHQLWLRQRLPKARALQRAQIEYSRLYPDQPGLWAGFVLYGEAE